MTNLEMIIETVKETAIEMVRMGTSLNDVAIEMSDRFGNEITRLIVADIALDLGMNNEAKEYLSKF
jgi:hypothetical protein